MPSAIDLFPKVEKLPGFAQFVGPAGHEFEEAVTPDLDCAVLHGVNRHAARKQLASGAHVDSLRAELTVLSDVLHELFSRRSDLTKLVVIELKVRSNRLSKSGKVATSEDVFEELTILFNNGSEERW